ncbi:MAG: type II toxin-antitoxin system prevent-host-death family antitoxin [bacterium]|nr:type II toxin-antitoxin system prevent-host-death family antitoxin [bacterium]
MPKTIAALKARRNLGELLNRAYYKGEDTIIEKRGKPIARVTRVEPTETDGIDVLMKTAGAWKDLNAEIIKNKIKKARKDKTSKKEFLASW